jgi:hypothetical protein
MTLRILDLAEADLLSGFGFYEGQSDGVGWKVQIEPGNWRGPLLLEFDHHHFKWLVAEVLFNVLGRAAPGDVACGGLQDF